ncbi:MAG: putative cyclophilin type peptidyl-prolyl cis-trans isomerase [Bacteroidetes bacterium]|jgi:cyclophilin family peptidyl-prolyl cis-trans isomerase|nr:putative cyclophilin type peptidyl-prolyl cis-trans isomerase [Bacteroidota bacterium]
MLRKLISHQIILFFLVISIPGSAQFTGVYTGKPRFDILVKRNNIAIGTINIELFPTIAPLHTRNFDSLVSEQFYDSTAFHRVIPGFMIQGGDPNSRSGPISTWGYGDPSQPTVNAEFSTAKHLRGILSAARDADTNSANSQFFICVAAASWLNGQYSVYGKVTGGMNIVDTIVNSPRDANDNPLQKIEMFITRNGSNDTIPNAPLLNLPASGSLVTGTSKLLRWYTVSDAIIYHLEVSTDSLFTTLHKSIKLSSIANTVANLSPATTYYWRVRSNNGGHFSAYSQVWNFNTSSGVGIDSFNEPLTDIIVSPNPSQGEFVFSNLKSGNKIEIYDITGKLINSSTVAGETGSVDLSGKSKGFYFYKIIEGRNAIHQGKLIIQ